MNKTTALKISRSEFSSVLKLTPDVRGWGFMAWDQRAKAWRACGSYYYNDARAALADAVSLRAYELMGGDACVAWNSDYRGSIQERLSAMMKCFPVDKYPAMKPEDLDWAA